LSGSDAAPGPSCSGLSHTDSRSLGVRKRASSALSRAGVRDRSVGLDEPGHARHLQHVAIHEHRIVFLPPGGLEQLKIQAADRAVQMMNLDLPPRGSAREADLSDRLARARGGRHFDRARLRDEPGHIDLERAQAHQLQVGVDAAKRLPDLLQDLILGPGQRMPGDQHRTRTGQGDLPFRAHLEDVLSAEPAPEIQLQEVAGPEDVGRRVDGPRLGNRWHVAPQLGGRLGGGRLRRASGLVEGIRDAVFVRRLRQGERIPRQHQSHEQREPRPPHARTSFSTFRFPYMRS